MIISVFIIMSEIFELELAVGDPQEVQLPNQFVLIHKTSTIWKFRTHQLITSWRAGVSPEAFVVLRVLVRGSVERVGGVGVGLEVDDDFLTCKHSYHYFPSQFDSSKWGILTLEQKTFESTAGG